MKKSQQNKFFTLFNKKSLVLLAAGVALLQPVAAQTYSFTPCGATGTLGPTQTQVNGSYASTNLNGQVTVTGIGIQQWIVPATGAYRIETDGAEGGTSAGTSAGAAGGKGASMIGEFNLTAGQTLSIVVGQMGGGSNSGGGGGGGSYVVAPGNTPLCVAGGGGGATGSGSSASLAGGFPGLTTTTGGNSNVQGGGTYGVQATGTGGGAAGFGGTNGYGGGSGVGAGGAGFTGDGAPGGTPSNPTYNAGGKSFLNGSGGGWGSPILNSGGFGGGGGTWASAGYGGGGGGYSGGGGGSLITNTGNGGGGGSFNSGTNQTNTSGVNLGDGKIFITKLCNVTISSTSTLICSGAAVTLSTSAVSNYSWSTGNTTSNSITVSPNTTTTYSVSGNGTVPSGCASTVAITVVVNASPTISINSSTTSACLGQSVTLTASGANTYTWNNSVINGTAFVPGGGTTTYTVAGTNACATVTAGITLTISTLPVTATTPPPALVCSGSPATLTAGGATTYTWNPGLSNQTVNIVAPVATTIYTVTGKAGNCLGTATVTVTTKPLPVMTIATSNSTTICNGNSATLTLSGDAVTYTWSVNNQTSSSIVISPTTTSVFSIIGINSVGCLRTVSQIITVNQNPVVSVAASDPVVCSAGSSTLAASGAPTYSWSNSALTSTTVVNPITDVTFTVSGINPTTTCHTETTVTVMVFVPVLSVTGNTSVCTGSNVSVSASGANSYTWINNGNTTQGITVSPAANTIYTVTGLVVNPLNGITCPATNTLEVDVYTPPTITASTNHTAICRGTTASLTAEGAGAAGTYTWASGLGNNPVISVAPILNQNYVVAGTDANGCKGTATVQVVVDGCTGINTISAGNINLTIYPNPSTGDFTITSDQVIDLHIVNELGQQVRVLSITTDSKKATVNNLANGVYFITGKNENGNVKQKIVVAK